MPDATQRDQLQAALGERYVLDRELGRGGMATVFLARDTKHDRPVALKLLHPDLAAALGPERFRREIALAARLQHPHILSVHDSGEGAPGQLWFTMPFVSGETLRSRLQRERQLPTADAIGITREIALALDYAHRNGVVHRDIKPENILLTDDRQALVADFGIARALNASGAAPGSTSLTETGLALGTPQYMSPEQASGDRALDARSDVYALGAVCFEMLAGEPPYTGPTPQAVIAKMMMARTAPSVRTLRPGVSEAVDAVIRRALDPIAAERFATAAEMPSQRRRRPPASTGWPPRRRLALWRPRLARVATGAPRQRWVRAALQRDHRRRQARRCGPLGVESPSRHWRLASGCCSVAACCSPGAPRGPGRRSPRGPMRRASPCCRLTTSGTPPTRTSLTG